MKLLRSFSAVVILFLLFSSFFSCKNAKEELVDQFVDCAKVKERCESRECVPPEPTQSQLDLIAICFTDCTTGGFGENGPPPGSPGQCQAFCENLVLGNNPPSNCDKKCDEEFYECFLGEDWEEVVNN